MTIQSKCIIITTIYELQYSINDVTLIIGAHPGTAGGYRRQLLLSPNFLQQKLVILLLYFYNDNHSFFPFVLLTPNYHKCLVSNKVCPFLNNNSLCINGKISWTYFFTKYSQTELWIQIADFFYLCGIRPAGYPAFHNKVLNNNSKVIKINNPFHLTMFCIIFKSDFYSFKPYIRPISYFLVEVSYIFLFSLIESFETPF